ncbi:hypothetical protein [Tautonia plasticadhaerens]|uniref:Uncharacterized protein n=1 Tax=Tautonia plasticadhaerens TaxID=2527974 RepID=A0A518HBE4_9BACT|nr:hypothetical protein [Tautonia plasticadhaerens]QDV38169.1 hypothetical protein ElP_61190 [Tautonia plasticadhaerens]
MDWTSSRPGIVFDLLVILFQVFGVLALVLSRLFATPRWSERGQWAFMVAVVGLGVAGALSGNQDSEFGLFAGLTMTTLLIGMTVGGGRDAADTPAVWAAPEGQPGS